MVDVKTLESFKYAEPFRPFEIELDDGRTIVVVKPETVGWAPEINTLMFPVGDDAIGWTKFKHVMAVRPLRRQRPHRKAS